MSPDTKPSSIPEPPKVDSQPSNPAGISSYQPPQPNYTGNNMPTTPPLESAQFSPLTPAPTSQPRVRLIVFSLLVLVVLIVVTVIVFASPKPKQPILETRAVSKSITPSHQAPASPPPITFSDPKGYFTFQYPGDWVEQTSSLQLDSIGGDQWLEEFNFVPSSQAQAIASSPDYNSFVVVDVVQGASGYNIVRQEQISGENFDVNKNMTINHYPAVYTEQTVIDSKIDSYIISNQDIAVIFSFTEKTGPISEGKAEKLTYPNGYDRSAYVSNLSQMVDSVKFLNATNTNGLLPGSESQ